MRPLFTEAIITPEPTALTTDNDTYLLDKLPGVKNAPAHAAALNLCAQQQPPPPDKFFEVRRGLGRGPLRE